MNGVVWSEDHHLVTNIEFFERESASNADMLAWEQVRVALRVSFLYSFFFFFRLFANPGTKEWKR